MSDSERTYPVSVGDDVEKALEYFGYPGNRTMRTVAIHFEIIYTDGETEFQHKYKRDMRASTASGEYPSKP